MYYYKRNIGDYYKKAGRLTMLQHGAYTQLIDACYDREVFPTVDDAIEWTWASSEEEVAAVKFVLQRFFTIEDGLHIQERIQKEVDNYKKNGETNRRIALDREAKRREKRTNRDSDNTEREHTVNESTTNEDEAPPNQEPRTKNQEPRTKDQKKVSQKLDYSSWPNMPEDQVLKDWKAMRTSMKAKVTQTVINTFAKEFIKAEPSGFSVDDCLTECVSRGWRGFKAEWLTNGQGVRRKQPDINQIGNAHTPPAGWED